ncbi:uncharacterized protein LOC123884755 isoform X2 [Trifolium pratense]|uniref:uncharacterized protein LOC123884755 isoform X2 n=1 Tax=Trifolium pratense TaxID=57577 RepID=UPI001E6919E8|nr:uncharacterized protein LOC123884755 isoform X2 [Trifolium pratense]
MASKKKQSEGIALLSMYNDNSDDEMEDAEEEEEENVMREEEQDEAAEQVAEEDLAADTDRMTVADSGNEVAGDGFTPTERSWTPLQEQLKVELRSSRSATLTIIDYGHDEVAMSPEPEDGEIDGSGRVMFGDQLHVTNGDLLDRTSSGTVQVLTPNNQANTPQFSETLKSDALYNDDMIRPDDAEVEGEADHDEDKPVDPLDKFLPPPPKVKCSEELQRKINKFLEYKKAGKSFNAEVRNRKDYRNPDFLLHAVRYQDIDQIGSCFSKDVFDPHGYDSSDFYDQIDIMSDMWRNLDVGVSYKRALRAKARASEIVEENGAKQYTLLWRYAAELKKHSKGNTTEISVQRIAPTIKPRFGSFYFSFDGCKKGFMASCRPFIGLEGCNLKTKFGGHLLIAAGRDANDQYYPLAFAVVENETQESWRWFVTLLLEDIGADKRLVFISDQQQGLIPAFEDMSDRVEHRLCLRSLYDNFKKRFKGGEVIRDLIMGAAKATYQQEWEKKMNELKSLDKKAWEWLSAHDPKLWCKHAFSFYAKCDVVMNRICEAFDATMLVATDKPIVTMCEWVRKYIMNRIASIKYELRLGSWNNRIMPMPMKRLNREIALSAGWLPIWSDDDKCEVEKIGGGNSFVVDLANRTCSCNFWELVGIPCRHVVAAMTRRSQTPQDYVDYYYSRDAYEKCYSFSVTPINGEEMWPCVKHEEMLPPSCNIGPERPKKRKKVSRRVPDEVRVYVDRPSTYKCKACGIRGHNAKGCRNTTKDPLAPPGKRKSSEEGGAHASLQNTSTAADQSTSSAQVETTAAAPIQTTTSTPVNVGVHRVNKKARITQPITIPHSATSESTQNHNPTTASATASKSRRKQINIDCRQLRRSGRICRGNPVQVDRVEPEPDVEIQQVNAGTSNLKGPSATASKCRIKQKNVDCSQLRRSERLCRDNPFPVDRLEPEPHVEIQIDHADTSNLKGPSATASKCRIKKKNVDCSQLRRSGRLCRDNPVAVDHVEPQPHVEIQIDDVETSNLKSPSKVKATASSKGSKSKKPVKKLDFTKLRRSGRTFYSGPKLKLGAPGTLKDNPITIDDIEEGDGEINTDDVDKRGADLTREFHDLTQQQFYDPRVGICLAAMRKWP